VSRIATIGRNIRFTILNRVASVAITFFLFPYIVRESGQEVYGVFLLVTTVTGYFGLLDLGVMSAVTKYVSEYNGKKDPAAVNRIVSASLSFYVLVGLVGALCLLGCSIYFDRFFRIDPRNVSLVRQLFIVAAASSLLTWPLSIFRGTVQGLNRYDVEAVVNIVVLCLNALGAVIVFGTGRGIVLYFTLLQFLNIAGCIVFYIVSRRIGRVRVSFPYLETETFKFIFGFSSFVFLSSLGNLFLFQAHNFIIGYFVSLSAVTVYAVAYNIQNYFRTINSAIGGPPWTVASEMEGRRDYEGQRTLLFKGTKYMSAIMLPVVLIMLFFVEPFINHWVGPGFEESILPARIIILFWLFNGTVEQASGMLSAKGIVKQPLFIQIGMAVFNLIVGLALIRSIGIVAMALGLTLSFIIVGAPLNLRLSLRALGVPLRQYLEKAVTANLPLYVLVAIISYLVSSNWSPGNIYTTLGGMAAIYLTSLIFYYFVIMNAGERREIRRLAGVEGLYSRISPK